MSGRERVLHGHIEGEQLQRLNSFEDFQATRPGRHGPPLGCSRFGEIPQKYTSEGDTPAAVDMTVTDPPETRSSPVPPSAATRKSELSRSTGPACPTTPVKLAPSPPSGVHDTARRPARPRSHSETGGEFMMRQAELCAHQQQGSPVAGMRRWRRATEGGESVMQAVIARRNLKHLQNGPEVHPSVWPQPPPRRSSHFQRRHTVGGVIAENGPTDVAHHLDLSNLQSDPNKRLEDLQDTVIALSNKLSTTTAHEAQLQKLVTHLQAKAKVSEAANAAAINSLRTENEQLCNSVMKLSADLERKSQLLEQVSATFPAYVDSLSSRHLGSLQSVLSKDQIHTLLEMLCLGADVAELHMLMLGESETGADILPLLHICGRMRHQFLDADAAVDAISDISDDRQQLQPSREKMAKLVQDRDSDALMASGMDESLVREILAATDMDPWSIINLLDGRVMRSGKMDMRLAIPLAGVLRSSTTENAHSLNDVPAILTKLAAKCALSPMRALKERNEELETNNIQLEAELQDMRHLLNLKQSNWKAEKLGPKVSSDIWRVDSVSTSGVSSPSSPAPSPLGAVF